jgi:hypothetical protein
MLSLTSYDSRTWRHPAYETYESLFVLGAFRVKVFEDTARFARFDDDEHMNTTPYRS